MAADCSRHRVDANTGKQWARCLTALATDAVLRCAVTKKGGGPGDSGTLCSIQGPSSRTSRGSPALGKRCRVVVDLERNGNALPW